MYMVSFKRLCLSLFFSIWFLAGDRIVGEAKPVMIFDLDDTLIAVNQWWSYPTIIWHAFPWDLWSLISLKSNRVKDNHGHNRFRAPIDDKKGEQFGPGGGATSLAFYGLYVNNSFRFQNLVTKILNAVWDNAVFMPGAKTLLTYLKAQDYVIVYATNKDYTSYKHVKREMDKKYNDFSSFPLFTLVTQPEKEVLERWRYAVQGKSKIPLKFKQLVEEIAYQKEDDLANNIYVIHQFEKPDNEYYLKLKELINKKVPQKSSNALGDKSYIFFDDKEQNIAAAKNNGINGYTVKNISDIVRGLEKEGIINRQKDKTLYEQLEKEGIFV